MMTGILYIPSLIWKINENTDASNTVSGNSVKNQTGSTVSGNTNTVSGNETTARQGTA